MQKKSILIIVTCLLFISARAQHHLWTFQECLDTAIQRNISLNESRLNNDLNRINLDQSKASLYPSLVQAVVMAWASGEASIPPPTSMLQKPLTQLLLGSIPR